MERKTAVKIFKALSDENRLMILSLIGNSQICACKLLENLEIGQPTLSHHMKILCDSGIVEATKEGKWMYYKINKSKYNETAKFLESALNKDALNSIKCSGC